LCYPLGVKYEPLDLRFWRKVNKTDGCWLWTAMTDASGYGRIQIGRVAALAHRVSWEMANGPIPAGRQVLHHCDNRPCVRPDHLFLGDNAANVADRVAKKRSRGAVGVRNPKAKLTAEQVAEIRRLYVPAPIGAPPKGERRSAAILAERFGVTRSTIYHIARGWNWK